jgi:multidrug efflux system membrane fusion protein
MNLFHRSVAIARRHRLRLLLPLTAVAALVAVLLPLRESPAAVRKPASAAAAPVPVSLATAERRALPLWIDALGTVTSLNAVSVRPRVDGQLQSVRFTEGQPVKAGDLLAIIDPRPFEVQLAQTQAVLAQEQAKLASNKVDLERATALAQAGAGPTQAVDTLRAQVTTQAARSAVDAAQLQLSYTRITSPADGRAGQRLVAVGSAVHTTDVPGIVTITQMHPIWVTFSVPQDMLPSILRERAGHALKVTALLRDRSRALSEGELIFVDSQVTATNGQIQLKARFDNSQPALWPGELVAVRMLLRTQADATVVPQAAVQQGPDGNFVYVADAQHLAEVRKVGVGDVVDGMQWIRTGLQPGETVVTQGQYRLAQGVPIAGPQNAVKPGVHP